MIILVFFLASMAAAFFLLQTLFKNTIASVIGALIFGVIGSTPYTGAIVIGVSLIVLFLTSRR